MIVRNPDSLINTIMENLTTVRSPPSKWREYSSQNVKSEHLGLNEWLGKSVGSAGS